MNGERFVRPLRERPKYKHTPILILTSEGSGANKTMFQEIGAIDWIQKPFDPTRLLTAVASKLN